MPQDVVVSKGHLPSGPMPRHLQAEIERALTLPYSVTPTASAEVIEAARGWLARADQKWSPASDADRDAAFNVLAAQPWFIPEALQRDRDAFFATYHADLHDVPSEALADACRLARLHCRRFPTSGQLREYALAYERWRSALRLKEGLRRLSVAKEREPGELATAEQWAELRERLAAAAPSERAEHA